MSANKNLQTLQNKLDDLSEITTLIREARDADVAELNAEIERLEKEIEVMNEHTQDYDTEVEMRSLAEKQVEELQNENELNKNMIQFLNEKVELLEKQLDRRD